MKDLDSLLVHSSWEPIFQPISGAISALLSQLDPQDTLPAYSSIFRAFEVDLNSVRCVIVGQDPYPSADNATGLAFSIPATTSKIPQSLRNIFTELQTDQGIATPQSGDLSRWCHSGVLLLNRVLTTQPGISDAHHHLGWQKITDHIAAELGKRDVVAILWGKQAQELGKFFVYRVESAHPSPLSAYRGFFGSRPFSRANDLLTAIGRDPIDWSL